MNIQDAMQTVELVNKVEILWQEREIVTAVLYDEYCKRNNLPVPKHIDELLRTAYDNLNSINKNEEATLEQKEIQQQNIKEGKKIFSPKDF